MMLLATVLVSALFIGGLFSLRAGERRQSQRDLMTYRLRFPRGLDTDAVNRFTSSLSGLLVPRYRRWLAPPVVTFETEATRSGIEHYVVVPKKSAAMVENLLQAHLPGVNYEAAVRPGRQMPVAAEYTMTSGIRPLRSEPEALAATMLASLQPLVGSQRIVVQWQVTPHGPLPPAGSTTRSLFAPAAKPSPAETAAARAKQGHPQMLAVGRIGATGTSTSSARQLLRRAEVAWHGTRAPGVHLKRRPFPERLAAARLERRSIPASAWPMVLGANELAGLLAWPIATVQVPGVSLGGHRQLAAARSVPRTGTVIGTSTFPGDARPVAIDLAGRLRHCHILGPTGVGKSTLAANLIAQDMSAGFGVVVIDPKGDLVTEVLGLVPEHRRHEVVVLDPADDRRPVGLNPLRSVHSSSEVAVENLVGLFKSLYRSSWGPRTDDILRAALQTLSATGGTTLCEVSLLLTDPGYRRRLVGSLDDPIGLEAFWGWYEAISDAERLSVVGPVLNKVRAFTMRPRVRAIVGQAEPQLDFSQVLRTGGIVLVSLASGLLGSEAADLLGALVLAELWHATTARAGLPAAQRRPVMAYLDEAQRVMHLPTSTADALAEARGFGLGLTLAHQHLGQLSTEMREAVLANARSRIVFQLGGNDARTMAKDLGGGLTADDLEGLGPYEIAAQLFSGGHRQPPLTAKAMPPAEPVTDATTLRAQSRQRFGIDRAKVEQAIRTRQQGAANTPEAVGTRRRTRRPGQAEDAS